MTVRATIGLPLFSGTDYIRRMVDEEIQTDNRKGWLATLVPSQTRERVEIGPPPEWVKAREIDLTQEGTETNNLILLDYQYNAERNERSQRIVRRVETMQALQELAQWKLIFDPATEHVTIHSVAVIRENSRVEYAQAERLRFLQREQELEKLVISGSITVVVLLEDVRLGDVIDASFSVRTTRTLVENMPGFFIAIPSAYAIRAFHMSVFFRTGTPMRWKSSDEESVPLIREADGITEWSWAREKLQPAKPEARVPSYHIAEAWLQTSSCGSWGEVAAGFTNAWKECAGDEALRQLAAEISSKHATPAERAEHAIQMVQDEIRYLSVNEDFGGQIPSPPTTVLQRRFGDCKDKTFLLAHLLRLLGIEACPVLVNAHLRQTIERLLPAVSAFNHAILQYELDGATYWVDPTITMQGGGAKNRHVPDYRLGLPLRPGATELVEIKQPGNDEGRLELNEEFNLDSRPNHPSVLRVTLRARGWNADGFRRNFATNGLSQVAQTREQFYRQYFPKAQRVGTLQPQDDRERNEFTLVETYSFEDGLVASKNPRKCIFTFSAHLIQSALGYPDSGKRRHPLSLVYPCNMEQRVELIIPESIGHIQPKAIRKSEEFEYTRESRKAFNQYSVTFTLRMLADQVKTERFESYKKTVGELWPGTNIQFHFTSGLAAVPRRGPGNGAVPPPIPRQADLPLKTEAAKLPQYKKGAPRQPEPGQEGYGTPRRRRRDPAAEYKKSRLIVAAVIASGAIMWLLLAWLLYRN